MSLALKFTTLLVRTLSKPMASAIKALAKNNDIFKQGCIGVAQFVHKADANMRMHILGEKKFKIRPLNDNKAIDLGANFLSELFIFSVAFGLVVYELYRSRKKASDQRDAFADDIEVLQGEIVGMKKRLRELGVAIDDYKIPDGCRPMYIKVDAEDYLKPSDELTKQANAVANASKDIKADVKVEGNDHGQDQS